MHFDLRTMDQRQLDAAARHYADDGYFVLEGVDAIANLFRPVLADRVGVSEQALTEILNPGNSGLFSPEIRRRLGRIDTPPGLARALITALEPLLLRLIGPLVHVSSTFHGQFKEQGAIPVDHGGYDAKADYLEVHGPYLLHQDFAGAAMPTSPSAVTLWTAMNSCSQWNLRLYPGSHKLGLLCNRWVGLSDERLARFAKPVDIEARAGTAVVFNAMMLHGTSNPGPSRRASCDLRFFPLFGFLPSEVHFLGSEKQNLLNEALKRAETPTLQAPVLEAMAFLGYEDKLEGVPPFSILNWVKFVTCMVRADKAGAIGHLERFVNTDVGFDTIEAYASKFLNPPIYDSTMQSVRNRLGQFAV